MLTVKTAAPGELKIPAAAVFHYIGGSGDKSALQPLVESCIGEMERVITPRACYDIFDIKKDGDDIDLGFAKVKSHNLSKNLGDCKRIILIAVTVGVGADRLVGRYSLVEPSRAVTLQAAGAAAVEEYLDEINDELKEKYDLVPRFSCGYGDLTLALQADIFKALPCEKTLGITLNSSFLMTPTKSVTAIIGIRSEKE